MTYLSLYRKYRPQTFAALVGQKHVSRTLQNAIAQGKVAHAYLFCGPRGTGKTTTARLLAKALNCEKGPTPEPDDTCEMCRAIAAGTALDVVEMDAASNRGIDEIRALRERIHFAPTQGAYKVYIVDEVHMLTPEAFNALLKVLEEPPERTIFVLCTTEAHKVPATIASRCQRFDFRRLTVSDLVGRLEYIAGEEGIEIDRHGLYEIALAAQGSLRDAISTLDQLAAFTDRKIGPDDVAGLLGVVEQDLLFGAVDHISDGDAGAALRFVAEALQSGHDPAGIVRGLLSHLRNLYVTKAAGDAPGVLDVAPEVHQRLVAQGRRFEERALERALSVLSTAQAELRGSPDARLLLEVTLVRLARPVQGLDELDVRVTELERRTRHAPGHPRADSPKASVTDRAPTGQATPPREEEEKPAPRAEAQPSPDEPPGGALEPAARADEARAVAEETQPVTEGAPPLAAPTTEYIQTKWSTFLNALGDVRLSGPLKDAEPAVRDGALVLMVPDRRRQDSFQRPDRLAALKAAAESLFGRPVDVVVEVGGRPAEKAAQLEARARRLEDQLGAQRVHQVRDTGDVTEE